MRLPTRLLRRRLRSHKGDYGHVLILAGSRRYVGAAALCAEAALRAGGGLVTVGIPEGLNACFVKIKIREVMTLPLPQTKDQALDKSSFNTVVRFARACDSVAIGPGLGRHTSTQNLVRRLVVSICNPLVIDADGLYALAGHLDLLKRKGNPETILTPHTAEMARLVNLSAEKIENSRKNVAKKFVSHYNSTVILKGHRTIVADYGGRTYINSTGNPGMATAGSGDVLTGIVAAFLGQGLTSFEAAKYGVYLHGLAGDLAAREKTQMSLIASDIIAKLPEAIKRSS